MSVRANDQSSVECMELKRLAGEAVRKAESGKQVERRPCGNSSRPGSNTASHGCLQSLRASRLRQLHERASSAKELPRRGETNLPLPMRYGLAVLSRTFRLWKEWNFSVLSCPHPLRSTFLPPEARRSGKASQHGRRTPQQLVPFQPLPRRAPHQTERIIENVLRTRVVLEKIGNIVDAALDNDPRRFCRVVLGDLFSGDDLHDRPVSTVPQAQHVLPALRRPPRHPSR